MKIERPKISNHIVSKNFTDIKAEENNILKSCIMNHVIFENKILDRLKLYDAVIKNCRFSNYDFSGFDLTDVRFENFFKC